MNESSVGQVLCWHSDNPVTGLPVSPFMFYPLTLTIKKKFPASLATSSVWKSDQPSGLCL